MSEYGYRVRPRSTAEIASATEAFVRDVAPGHLTAGVALDLAELVDRGLEQQRITVCPVADEDLPDSEAETRAGPGGWIEIWIREAFYDALFEDLSKTVRARSTLAHELGHAVLHAEEVRAGRHRPHALALRRALRSDLRPFEDSEWQAHAFAGMLLVPPTALSKLHRKDPALLAERFLVSEPFVRSHLRRLRRL